MRYATLRTLGQAASSGGAISEAPVLTASGGASSITLTLSPPGDADYDHCEIHRWTSSTEPTKLTDLTSGTYTDSAVVAGTIYTYAAVAVDSSGANPRISKPVSSKTTTAVVPIVEQIAQAVLAKLQAITAANGYQVTVASATRPIRYGDDWTPNDLTIRMIQGDSNRIDDEAYSFAERYENFAIALFVRQSESSTTPDDTKINLFRSEVEKALMEDPQWGGLAVDSRVGDFVRFDEQNGAFAGDETIYTVHFRTLDTDPYSQGE